MVNETRSHYRSRTAAEPDISHGKVGLSMARGSICCHRSERELASPLIVTSKVLEPISEYVIVIYIYVFFFLKKTPRCACVAVIEPPWPSSYDTDSRKRPSADKTK